MIQTWLSLAHLVDACAVVSWRVLSLIAAERKGRRASKVRVSLLVGGPCNVGPGMVVGEAQFSGLYGRIYESTHGFI